MSPVLNDRVPVVRTIGSSPAVGVLRLVPRIVLPLFGLSVTRLRLFDTLAKPWRTGTPHA
jgi:hypothetical protein